MTSAKEVQVTYFTDAPKINGEFAEILAKFKAMRQDDCSLKQIRESFLKDELVALAIWFMEQNLENTEGGHNSDLLAQYAEYEEVTHV
jgi:hypothetical protein